MPELLRDGLFARMAMEHRDEVGVVVFTSQGWRRLFDTRGHWFGSSFWSSLARLNLESESERMINGKGDLHDYWRDISIDGDFLGPPPSYTLIRDSVLRLCHRMMAHNIAGRSQAPEKHFGLLTTEILGGLTVIALELTMIDMPELVRLQICVQLDYTLAWVDMGPERQPDAAAGALAVAEDAPAIDEGDQAISVPIQAPQQPPPSPPAPARTMP
ncbi:hypothetical protein Tco_1061466 [Tanacetum coccineum]